MSTLSVTKCVFGVKRGPEIPGAISELTLVGAARAQGGIA